jgi:transposase
MPTRWRGCSTCWRPAHAATVRIFVCTRPHDMRCSYDTLALATQTVLGQDPRSGALFVFTNKRLEAGE